MTTAGRSPPAPPPHTTTCEQPSGSTEKAVNVSLSQQPDNLDTIGAEALAYASNHWAVFPLRGKVPAIPNPHPKGSTERETCKGECGQQGHGLFDATTDVEQVIVWWSGRCRGC